MNTRETTETFVLTKDQVFDMKKVQHAIKTDGFQNYDEDALISGLEQGAAVLAFAYMLPTPVTLAAGILSSLQAASGSMIDALENMCERGGTYLDHLHIIMDDNPEIEYLKVTLPCFEFIDEDYRIISGYGIVEKVRAYNEWVNPGVFGDIEWSV
jgi:hypothetical protein